MAADVHGILLLDKPLGVSSAGAVARVKRLFAARKAGHTGSLDPLASGMLPICLGEATKFGAQLLDADKTYRVSVRLGERTRERRSRIGGDRAARAAVLFGAPDRTGARGVSARVRAGAADAFSHQTGRQTALRIRARGRVARAGAARDRDPRDAPARLAGAGPVLRCAVHEGRLHTGPGRGSGAAARDRRACRRLAQAGGGSVREPAAMDARGAWSP